MGSQAAITLENVSVRQQGVRILESVTTQIPARQVTAIIGPNGGGKTTLLRAILRLIPFSGSISFTEPNARIGYVPQRLEFDRGAPITVRDFLVMPRQRVPLWFGVSRQRRERAVEFLRQVRAEHLLMRPLGKLSGGELQRVQLAQALQEEPSIVLLDEPVSGVDVAGEQLFCELLEQVSQVRRLTMIMVTHDLAVVSRYASHVICINRRVQREGHPREVVTADSLATIYGATGLDRADAATFAEGDRR
ncbi:Zinc import ATP-binding protein ZnuC [Planctomycetes bacterium Pan216]|uniref:Zinc import ATP-binding protein ZnuC n=2 Tax=Kolteria novifilia TaxID=2527975 RepID=A0A518AZL3_9BACT|nr:Zinc import ATP-binding protein ZnuC [Planctomycetes bacterium Pan216]